MNKLLFVLFMSFYSFLSKAQTDTIRMAKPFETIYRCKDKEAKNWYLYSDNNLHFILANLNLPEVEVRAWFLRFRNSQNLYAGDLSFQGNKKYIILSKHDQTDDRLTMEVVEIGEESITLREYQGERVYVFEKVSD